jgi:S1-C subfamily serine protease
MEDATKYLITEVKKLGYSGFEGQKFTTDVDKRNRFSIQAEIDEIDINEYINPDIEIGSGLFGVDNHGSLKINWSIYDNKKQKTVFQNSTEIKVLGNDQSFEVMILRAISGSVKKLFILEDVIKLLEKKQHETFLEAESLETLLLPKVTAKTKLSEIIESAVTLVSGDRHGSGFFISEDGYILTNYHVVDTAKVIKVIMSNGLTFNGDVARVNSKVDLALVKLQGSGFKPISIFENEVVVGTDVVAIGTPGKIELGQTVTKGIIGGKREFYGNVYLQTDVSISPGNSGGPLVISNTNQVIGIINSKMIGFGVEGIGFAIPINVALSKLSILIK